MPVNRASLGSADKIGWLTGFWRDQSVAGKVVIVLLPVLLMAMVYMRVYWFETDTFDQNVGLNGEAATNPFFGFETLAKSNLDTRKGSFIRLEESVDPAQYAPESSLIMLSAWRLSRMTPQRVKAIVEWVKRGGNLVLEAEMPGQDDPLLKAVGMERGRVVWKKTGWVELPPKRKKAATGDDFEDDDEDESDIAPTVQRQLSKVLNLGESAMRFDWDDGETYRIKLGQPSSLRLLVPDDKAFVVPSSVGNRIIKRQLGKGQVVAMVTFGFMRRAAILKDDAGVFAMRLLEPHARPAPVVETIAAVDDAVPADADTAANAGAAALVLAAAPPPRPANPAMVVLGLDFQPNSLLDWLFKHGQAIMLAALALFLIWLWHIIPRFGPIAAPQTEARRNIADHWRAAGQYLLHRRDWAGLLEAPRHRVARRLRQRLGFNITMPARSGEAAMQVTALAPAQLARLELVCKVSAGRIDSALHATPTTATQLLAFATTLRQMEAALK